jgi:hypothetical protein
MSKTEDMPLWAPTAERIAAARLTAFAAQARARRLCRH